MWQEFTQHPKLREAISQQASELFQKHRQEIYCHTDRLFVRLMIFQWLAAIVAALVISPRTWSGTMSSVHIHLWAAVLLGGAITFFPVVLGLLYPGKPVTRYVISVSQVLFSALLIHLSGGRIETHFHIFGSLAFIAFYRDWRVLIPATLVVAMDHLIRGIYWPQSVFGVLVASEWRWLEHAAWVIFEDIFLIISCRRSIREMKSIAENTAQLEATNKLVEAKVQERTLELTEANQKLEAEMNERARLEGVVVQSEKMAAVGQLAGGVAHEINNPLGVILGFAQSIVRRVQSGDPLEMPLKSIEREAIRCKQLVQDLLTFSRVEKSVAEPADINEVIEGALSLVSAQTKVNNVALVKKFAEGLPKVTANRGQIQQVIVNLANNSVDAMPGGGTLSITTQALQNNGHSFVQIQVQDTGQGIPPEIQKRIFDPFFTTKEIGKGTGLGLSLVYEIVKKHNGQIQVASQSGKGTAFNILLPVAA